MEHNTETELNDQLQQIAEGSKKSTVYLKTRLLGLTFQVGTGFFIEPDKIATNIHVIEGGCPGCSIKIVTAEQLEIGQIPLIQRISKPINSIFQQLFVGILKRLKADGYQKPNHLQNVKETPEYIIEGVTAYDDRNDLVVLKVTEAGVPLPLGNYDNFESGEQVSIVGYNKKEYKSIAGTISGEQYNDKQLQIKVNLPTDHTVGHSGGPVLNNKGEVIGVVYSVMGSGSDKDDTVGENSTSFVYAIPLTILKALLASSGDVETISDWWQHPRTRAYGKMALGNSKLNARKYKRAISYYDAALKLNPDITLAYINRGRAHGKLGESKAKQGVLVEARSHYQMAIDGYNRVINFEARSHYQMTIDDYNKVINNKGNIQEHLRSIAYNGRAWTNYLLGQIETKEGNIQEAKRFFQETVLDANEALRMQPEGDSLRSSYFHTCGAAKAALGDHREAIEDFDESIRLNPKKALFYQDRAISKQALGQHEAAEADFAKAKELDPNLKE